MRLAQRKGYTAIVNMLQNAQQNRYGVSIGSVPGTAFGTSAKDYFNHGKVNTPSWIHQKIQERGTAYISTRHQSSRRAFLRASRVARIYAQRRLLNLVLDLRLDSQTTIRNVLTEDDLNLYYGITRNSYYVDRYYNDTIYTVTYGLNLNDVYLYMKEKGIYYK